MTDERAKIYRDGIVDGVAVLVLAALMFAGKLGGETGALAIVGLAGGSVLARTLTTTLGSRFSTRPPPPIVALVALASTAWMVARVAAVTGVLAACAVGCGAASSGPSIACTAVRSARAAAELAEPYVCEPPDGSAP